MGETGLSKTHKTADSMAQPAVFFLIELNALWRPHRDPSAAESRSLPWLDSAVEKNKTLSSRLGSFAAEAVPDQVEHRFEVALVNPTTGSPLDVPLVGYLLWADSAAAEQALGA